MSTYHVESKFEIRAPAAVIWEALVDARSWPTWAPNDDASLEREGDPAPNGMGAVRVFRTGKVTVREKVVRYEPETRFSYQLLSGLPVKDYTGDVILTSHDDRGVTELLWQADWKGKFPYPGTLVRRRLQEVLDEWGTALKRHAERAAAGTGG